MAAHQKETSTSSEVTLINFRSGPEVQTMTLARSCCFCKTARKHLFSRYRIVDFDSRANLHDTQPSGKTSNPEKAEDHHDEDGKLYPNHIPTSTLQKGILAVGSAVVSLAAPWRADMISVMGEVTGYPALMYMRNKMFNDPVGKQILEEQPRINSRTVNLEDLRSLPEGTFGREYRKFLDDNRVTPDSRDPVQFVDDPDLAYVMLRYRQTHDLYHTLLGMPTNMLGEVTVKWIEGLQLGLPLGLTGGTFGALRLGPKHREYYLQTHLPWAWRVGRNAKFLLNCYYEHHWETPLTELRELMNIEEPPYTPRKQNSSS